MGLSARSAPLSSAVMSLPIQVVFLSFLGVCRSCLVCALLLTLSLSSSVLSHPPDGTRVGWFGACVHVLDCS